MTSFPSDWILKLFRYAFLSFVAVKDERTKSQSSLS